jgi:hypothetical protein
MDFNYSSGEAALCLSSVIAHVVVFVCVQVQGTCRSVCCVAQLRLVWRSCMMALLIQSPVAAYA